MFGMAERKKKQQSGQKRVRTGTAINVYVDDALGAAMNGYLDGTEPYISKTAYIEALIKADLRSRGLWPPQQSGPK